MSKGSDTKKRGAAPVALDGDQLRDNVIESLKNGSIAAVLVVNNMDGVHIGRRGYEVPVMPGYDYVVLAVSRAWHDLGERIAVLRLTHKEEEQDELSTEYGAD